MTEISDICLYLSLFFTYSLLEWTRTLRCKVSSVAHHMQRDNVHERVGSGMYAAQETSSTGFNVLGKRWWQIHPHALRIHLMRRQVKINCVKNTAIVLAMLSIAPDL